MAKPPWSHQLARRSTILHPDSQEHNHEHRDIQTGSNTNLAKERVFLRPRRGVLMTLPLPCRTEHFLGDQAGSQPHLILFIFEDWTPEGPEVPFQVG